MNKKVTFSGVIEVEIIEDKEAKCFVAINDKLDLATQGDTIEEAKLMFHEALEIFINDLIENNNLEKVF